MKFLKRALPIVLAVCLLASLGAVSAIDAGETRTVIGADLTDDQIKTVYKTFGIERGSVKELAAGRFNSLSVLLVEAAEVLPRRAPGLPDEAFERGDVPMTKQEVRAAVLAKLAVRPEDILWDVGAGTGSVSVELALAAPRGRVYAVECRPEGCALIKANREKFRTRADGQRPDRAGEPDRRQPGQGRGRAAPHDGPEPHLPHHRRMT